MVGEGIFAILGLAVSIAKGGTLVAFLIAGIIALITSYSYVKLSLTYPDRGGTVKFINQAFGINVFSGGILLHHFFNRNSSIFNCFWVMSFLIFSQLRNRHFLCY